MNKTAETPPDRQAAGVNRLTYITGFVLSLALTMSAYLLVRRHLHTHHLQPSDKFMLIALAALAIAQLFTQLIFFLHLDRESKPRWNLMAAIFAAIIVFIIVGGSLWIMYHLNYDMSPQQMNQYMQQQESGGL